MKRFWISWQQPGDDYRPMTFPIAIDWWKSGEAGDGTYSTIVAIVDAESEEAAKATITALYHWPDAGEWRFCNEKPLNWIPSSRFPMEKKA